MFEMYICGSWIANWSREWQQLAEVEITCFGRAETAIKNRQIAALHIIRYSVRFTMIVIHISFPLLFFN
jgi:hypothetical protein